MSQKYLKCYRTRFKSNLTLKPSILSEMRTKTKVCSISNQLKQREEDQSSLSKAVKNSRALPSDIEPSIATARVAPCELIPITYQLLLKASSLTWRKVARTRQKIRHASAIRLWAIWRMKVLQAKRGVTAPLRWARLQTLKMGCSLHRTRVKRSSTTEPKLSLLNLQI